MLIVRLESFLHLGLVALCSVRVSGVGLFVVDGEFGLLVMLIVGHAKLIAAHS